MNSLSLAIACIVVFLVLLMWFRGVGSTHSYSTIPPYMQKRYGPPWDQKAPVPVSGCGCGKV